MLTIPCVVLEKEKKRKVYDTTKYLIWTTKIHRAGLGRVGLLEYALNCESHISRFAILSIECEVSFRLSVKDIFSHSHRGKERAAEMVDATTE